MRRISVQVLAILVLIVSSLHAEESLAPTVLKDLKGATVYVKVYARPLKVSGSGFLIKLDKGTGYIITNNHVIDMSTPHVVTDELHRRHTITISGRAEISVVFFSGTSDELVLPAEVVAADKERDLAVLLVKGIKRELKPIDLNVPASMVETTPVYVFGFPFGEKMSVEGSNPAITVGRGTVSSIRLNKKGDVGAVQIDGALNPGNSGGPVVDAKGRLAGVAVATIVGSGIGFAIPPSVLKEELIGRAGIARIVATKDNKRSTFKADVTVPLIDPMGQLRSVTLHWTQADVASRLKPGAHLGELASAHAIKLKIEGHDASGTFEVPVVTGAPTVIVYEVSCANGINVTFSGQSDPLSLGESGSSAASASTGAPLQPGAAHNPADSPDNDKSAGPDSTDAALTAMTSENEHTQRSAAEELCIAPLKARHRSAVLAAMEPHLASSDLSLRWACVRAYAHWATVGEVHVLEKVAEMPQEHAELSNAKASWAAAMVGLVRLDPAAADRVYAARKQDFFFCDGVSAALLKLAECEPQHAAAAIQLLRRYDVFHSVTKISLSQAEQMLQSDADSTRAAGCEAIKIAPIESAERKRVLSLMAPHLNTVDAAARAKYVHAYVHWADASNLRDLQAIVEFPKAGPIDGHDQSWSAAIIGMVRLREVNAVIESYNSHYDDVSLHSNFTMALHDVAEGTAPEQALAANFLQQLKDGHTPKLHALDAVDPKTATTQAPTPSVPPPGSPATTQPGETDNPPSGETGPAISGELHGQIRGKAFAPNHIEMMNGWLVLRSGEAHGDKEIKITLNIRSGEPISGRKFHIEWEDGPRVRKPVIFITYKSSGRNTPNTFVAQRYQMDLEFGKLADDKIPGTIKLTVEDEQGTDLTGSFVAEFK